MAQYCRSCKATDATRLRTTYLDKGGIIDSCDKCSTKTWQGIPDVYLGPGGGSKTEENLADPKSGKPIPFSSKTDKAAIMKQLNLKQHPGAERTHGYRNEKYLKGKKIYG